MLTCGCSVLFASCNAALLLQTSSLCSSSGCHLLCPHKGFTPAHGNVTSPHKSVILPLFSGGCAPVSPPLLPAPLPGLAYSLLLGLPDMGLGPPKSESGPGLGCCARSVPCSHTGTSLGDGSGALSASCTASAVKLSWPSSLLLLDLPLCLVSCLALVWFRASLLHP